MSENNGDPKAGTHSERFKVYRHRRWLFSRERNGAKLTAVWDGSSARRQAGSLCHIAHRSVERYLNGILTGMPATPHRSIGFQPVFRSHPLPGNRSVPMEEAVRSSLRTTYAQNQENKRAAKLLRFRAFALQIRRRWSHGSGREGCDRRCCRGCWRWRRSGFDSRGGGIPRG